MLKPLDLQDRSSIYGSEEAGRRLAAMLEKGSIPTLAGHAGGAHRWPPDRRQRHHRLLRTAHGLVGGAESGTDLRLVIRRHRLPAPSATSSEPSSAGSSSEAGTTSPTVTAGPSWCEERHQPETATGLKASESGDHSGVGHSSEARSAPLVRKRHPVCLLVLAHDDPTKVEAPGGLPVRAVQSKLAEGDGDLDVSSVLIDAGLANPHRVPVGSPSKT